MVSRDLSRSGLPSICGGAADSAGVLDPLSRVFLIHLTRNFATSLAKMPLLPCMLEVLTVAILWSTGGQLAAVPTGLGSGT